MYDVWMYECVDVWMYGWDKGTGKMWFGQEERVGETFFCFFLS